jgi:hypothetical protein
MSLEGRRKAEFGEASAKERATDTKVIIIM